jgi:hypothetical protein
MDINATQKLRLALSYLQKIQSEGGRVILSQLEETLQTLTEDFTEQDEPEEACGHSLSESQKLALRCAHADLIGSLQVFNSGRLADHNWDAHLRSIHGLEHEFADVIDPAPKDLEVGSW